MCGVLFTWWAGRKNNGPIGQNNVRGSAINTRVVKLAPLDAKQGERPKTVEDKGTHESSKNLEGSS